MDRLLVDVAGTLALGVTDANGDATDFDAAPTVTVKDGAGAALDTGTATNVGIGSYEYVFTPDTLDTVTVVWAGDLSGNLTTFTTVAQVVGGIPLSVGQVRAVDEDLEDIVKYPADAVAEAIEAAWEQAELAMRVAIVPTGGRATLDGEMLLPSVAVGGIYTVDGAATTVTVKDAGVLSEPVTGVVHYWHGWTVTPAPVIRALRALAVSYLVSAATPTRATSLSTDVGAFRLTVAGRDGWTGLPEVDAVFDQFGYAVGFA